MGKLTLRHCIVKIHNESFGLVPQQTKYMYLCSDIIYPVVP